LSWSIAEAARRLGVVDEATWGAWEREGVVQWPRYQNMSSTPCRRCQFTLNNASDMVGENLTLNVSAVVNGNTLTASTPADLSIAGTNPVRANIQNNSGG
jgi:hypothetical protein